MLQGAVILLGKTNMFRYNNPAEAQKLKSELKNVGYRSKMFFYLQELIRWWAIKHKKKKNTHIHVHVCVPYFTYWTLKIDITFKKHNKCFKVEMKNIKILISFSVVWAFPEPLCWANPCLIYTDLQKTSPLCLWGKISDWGYIIYAFVWKPETIRRNDQEKSFMYQYNRINLSKMNVDNYFR